MSYILDALRRAEAERERGEVPSLHAQQFPTFSSEGDEPGRSRWLVGAVVVLGLALVAALAWNFFAAAPAPTPVVQAVTPAPPVVAAPPPVVAIAPAVVAAPPQPSPPPATASTARPSPLPTTGAAAPTPAPATPVERRARRAEPAAAPAPAPLPSPSAAKAGADNRIHTFAELPEAIRREMPKLAFGGASYSTDAKSRMVILNGQVFHEGDKVASGVVLQQIKLKGAVLTYKGYRYELGY